MGKRESLVSAYIEAMPARALFIHAGPNGQPAKLSTEPTRKLDLFDALWFAKAVHLELVLMRVRGDLAAVGAMRPQGWIDLPAREVRDTVVNAAAILGARWRVEADIRRDALAAVERILAHVEAQRRSGGLAQVNAQYKIYRQRQAEKGEAAAPYSAHLNTFTRSLVVLAAQNENPV